MGKRGRPKRHHRESALERRADGFRKQDEIHKHRADIIELSLFPAAIWSVANLVAHARGVLPYPFMTYIYTQYAIYACYGLVGYYVFWHNRKHPVYREAYWMIFIYCLVVGLVMAWSMEGP